MLPNRFVAIAYVSLFSAAIVAGFITKSAVVFFGGLAGAVLAIRLLIWGS